MLNVYRQGEVVRGTSAGIAVLIGLNNRPVFIALQHQRIFTLKYFNDSAALPLVGQGLTQ